MRRDAMLIPMLLALGCVPGVDVPPSVDFVPLRPGVCVEAQVSCDDGHAWVEVTPEFAPRTLVYVIDTLSFPAVDAEGRVAGFDLDGMDSGTGTDAPEAACAEARADYVSNVDPNLSGVDNQIQLLLPTLDSHFEPSDCPGATVEGCANTALQGAIDGGLMLFLLEVSGVESFTTDEHVDVALYRATAPVGSTPALSPDGRLAPEQVFRGAIVDEGPGTILGGRLTFSISHMPLEVFTPDYRFPFELRDVQVRADLLEAGLGLGVIGGKHHPTPAADEPACTFVLTADFIDASLDDETCCGPPGACCNAISAGLVFTATRAERRP